MRMQDFIRNNREEIDRVIDRQVGFVPKTASCYCPESGTDHFHKPERRNDSERKDWILNDESLYLWARSEEVKI